MRRITRWIKTFFATYFLAQRNLLKDAFTLFSGSTIAQLIPLLAGPLLARLYSPEDFGFFALMATTAGLISIISTGSFEFAIVYAHDEDADDLMFLATRLSVFFSLVSAVFVFLLLITANLQVDNPYRWAWMLVPLYTFFHGFMNTLNYSLNRQEKYKCMAKGKVIRNFVMTLFQLSFGAFGIRWGLLPGVVCGQISADSFLLSRLKRIRLFKKRFSKQRLLEIVKKYHRFPFYLMPSQIVNELSVQVPIYFLTAFSTTAVGYYALPQKFLNVPVVLIGSAIGHVFFKDAAKQRHNPDNLKKVTQSLFQMLFFIGVIPFSIVLVHGDILVSWFFGQDWYQSGVYAQYLSPWLMFVLIGSPISRLFTVLDRQREGLWFNIVLLSVRVLSLAIGTFILHSADLAVKLFAISGAVYWVFLSFYILRMVKVKLFPLVIKTFSIWAIVVALLSLVKFLFL